MDDRPGVANLVDALGVRRRAMVGFGLGGLFAAAVYVFFIVLGDSPVPFRYLVLAFVLAVTLGLFITVVLVFVRAARLAREQGSD